MVARTEFIDSLARLVEVPGRPRTREHGQFMDPNYTVFLHDARRTRTLL